MQVVDVDAVLDDVEAELVGLAERDARLDAAAGQPHGEGVGVMVAAVVAALHHRRAAELAAPDDQRVVEQAALLQVLDERGAGLVGVLAVLLEVARPGCRAGPRPRGRAARSARRARPAGGPAGSCWRTTACPARRRTSRACACGSCDRSISSGALVCMRKAISKRADARGDLRDRRPRRGACWLSRASASSESRCSSRVDAGRVGEVQDRVAAAAERHALVDGRQEAAAPVRVAAAGALAAGAEDDEAGQVLRLAAQAVGHPRAHARPAELLASRCSSRSGRARG